MNRSRAATTCGMSKISSVKPVRAPSASAMSAHGHVDADDRDAPRGSRPRRSPGSARCACARRCRARRSRGRPPCTARLPGAGLPLLRSSRRRRRTAATISSIGPPAAAAGQPGGADVAETQAGVARSELLRTARAAGAGVRRARLALRPRGGRSRTRTTPSCARPASSGSASPRRYGGLGASFADYMHVAAELARFCPMTALTFNMHSQTMLWTGIVADDLDLSEDDRERHERTRLALYRGMPGGRRDPLPAAVGGRLARGDGRASRRSAVPTEGGWRISGKQDLRLAGRRRHFYNLTCVVPGEERRSASSPCAATRRACASSATGTRSACAARTPARCSSRTPSSRTTPSSCRPAPTTSSRARWPYVYLTLTPTYMGLTRAVVDFVQGYLGGAAPPGIAARRDVPQKQAGWAQIQILHEQAPRAVGGRGGGGRRRSRRPTPCAARGPRTTR